MYLNIHFGNGNRVLFMEMEMEIVYPWNNGGSFNMCPCIPDRIGI